MPCLWTSCTTYWTTSAYDLIGRPAAISRPISDTNPSLQTTDIYYEGLTTRVRDPLLKLSHQIVDAAGQISRSQDHDGYYQSFEYNGFGNPMRVLDQPGNQLQASTYNVRGMLLTRTDMEMGAWTYKPNAVGEVLNIRDAKTTAPLWTQTLLYDALGRLTSRTEAEGTSTWTWGTSSAAKNIGQLASLSGPGYSESYTYNAQANMNARTITTGATNYLINYGYNSQGTLDQVTYPTSTSGYRLKLKYDYQNGALYRIRDFNALTTVFWIANASDARNQITQEGLLNGLITNRSTDAVTGWLKSIQTGAGGGTGVQNLAYQWGLTGNLTQRKDINQSNLTEDFFYDNLHRLDYSNRNGVLNLDVSYDALGNIATKSDVGTYTYHASKKHQVTATTNGWSFGYDNNGNMSSGRGATMTWMSFNYPASISNGTDTSSFSYTPDRQYWQQISNYTSGGSATTVYIGGLLEKVTTSAGTDYRHMIRAGGSTIIVSRKSTGVNTLNYVTSDHLGSSSAITDSVGGMLVNSSFDAFGKRRGANWTGSPSAGDWTGIAGTTRRGYTEHSMLDNLNLTHMNGRVYDPVIGRFLSADPYITEPFRTQNFNRYSYVYNNPLGLIDPTGFDSDTSVRFPPILIDPTPGEWSPCIAQIMTPGCEPGIFAEPDFSAGCIDAECVPPAVDWSSHKPRFEGGPVDTWLHSVFDPPAAIQSLFQYECNPPACMDVSALIGGRIGARPTAARGTLNSGARPGGLTASEAQRVQNAANRLGKPIDVVGSRARGKATGDYDYVIDANNRVRNSASRSLPGAGNVSEGVRPNLDVFKGPVDPARPSIRFDPEGP